MITESLYGHIQAPESTLVPWRPRQPMNTADDEVIPTKEAPPEGPGRLARTLRDGAWILGAITLYLLLQLVVLPRFGFQT